VEARQLAGANISPVCRIQCGKQTAQTRIKHSTNSPYWNETFFFSFSLPPGELFNETLYFDVSLIFQLEAISGVQESHLVGWRGLRTPKDL